MRLALVTNDYPPKPGGIQQYLGNLMDAWDGPVRILAPHDEPAISTVRGEQPVRRFRPNFGPPANFLWPTKSVVRWVIAELSEFAPDAVLIGAPHPLTGLIPRIRDSLSVPVGVLAHGAEVTIPASIPGVRQAFGALLARADVRFAVSRFTATNVERLSGKRCRFVGAGVDLAAFAPTTRQRGERLVIGSVSRFVPRKNQAWVIEAANRLVASGISCEVVLVGKGRLEPQLRKAAAEANAPVRLEVDVPWERLPELYRSFDIFCMPCRSRWGGLEVEGLGLVFLEAAASGLPVLAGDSGGAAETVIPAKTGFVVRNVDDIVEAVEMVVSDTALMAHMGVAGRHFVESEFSWKRTAERFVEGFEAAQIPTSDLDT